MEKLKAKHDHKLTDILKVAIFGLMLILPGLILLPSMLYYGVNEYAIAPTEQVEIYEYEQVNFNQLIDIQEDVKYTKINSYTIEISNDVTGYLYLTEEFNLNIGDKYLYKGVCSTNAFRTTANGDFIYQDSQSFENGFDQLFTATQTSQTIIVTTNDLTVGKSLIKLNLFNLTQMFGNGNEPTIQQFNDWYTEGYYEYTTSEYQTLEIPTGTYETYTDITKQIQYNWNSLWQQPLFNWTNYTIIKKGIDNFTGVFGITNTSNISNLIAYELIIVAIYIVIDIVLTLFKWLTHLIGEK